MNIFGISMYKTENSFSIGQPWVDPFSFSDMYYMTIETKKPRCREA